MKKLFISVSLFLLVVSCSKYLVEKEFLGDYEMSGIYVECSYFDCDTTLITANADIQNFEDRDRYLIVPDNGLQFSGYIDIVSRTESEIVFDQSTPDNDNWFEKLSMNLETKEMTYKEYSTFSTFELHEKNARYTILRGFKK